MRTHLAACLLVLACGVVAIGQPRSWRAALTPDGQIDIEGVWDFSTITPLERPNGLGDKSTFTDAEAASFEREENLRQNRDLIDPKKGSAQYLPGSVIPYNEFWYERGSTIIGTKRTSLIVDPPDGRIPPLTPQAKQKQDADAAIAREEQLGRVRADSPQSRSVSDRCILGFNAGPPMTPGAYNNHVQITQAPGFVTLVPEMVGDARVIPVDGRSHLSSSIRQYQGDSRGHWQAGTLVIETTNFLRETSFRGSSANLRLTERLTRVDADTLMYEFTVYDPNVWTKPWSVAVPMRKMNEPIYEYACHEGNYAMRNILSGARAQDAK
ncbi:MAG TPA: hypothetical protein VH436_06290 [Vicinamibacterales bacterium]|jgi:hypothetical protein